MKTPREVLLSRHAKVELRLDAIRRAVVAEHVVPTRQADRRGSRRPWWRALVELFWVDRRVWAGLAAVWLVILGLNLGSRPGGGGKAVIAAGRFSGAELRVVLLEQVRLRQELMGESVASAVTAASTHGPRSDRKATWQAM